jgi:hypothetical protein
MDRSLFRHHAAAPTRVSFFASALIQSLAKERNRVTTTGNLGKDTCVATKIETTLGQADNDRVETLLKELVQEIKNHKVPPAILDLAEQLQRCLDQADPKTTTSTDTSLPGAD